MTKAYPHLPLSLGACNVCLHVCVCVCICVRARKCVCTKVCIFVHECVCACVRTLAWTPSVSIFLFAMTCSTYLAMACGNTLQWLVAQGLRIKVGPTRYTLQCISIE